MQILAIFIWGKEHEGNVKRKCERNGERGQIKRKFNLKRGKIYTK
jgi:hypothetical protein